MLTITGGGRAVNWRSTASRPLGITLRLMIPVNVRAEGEKGALGNRVSMMLPEIPAGITDLAERLTAVRAEMERLKSNNQCERSRGARALVDNLSAAYHALLGSRRRPPGGANLVCTNVPGPMIPLYRVGHRMLAHYPMVPLAGDMGIGSASRASTSPSTSVS